MKIFCLKFTVFYIGCFSCWFLQSSWGLSSVLSAVIVGFVGSFYQISGRVKKEHIQSVIYTGAFAGMCTREILSGHEHVVLISLFGATLYLLSKSHINGFGGKLGTIAFVSSVLLMMVRSLW